MTLPKKWAENRTTPAGNKPKLVRETVSDAGVSCFNAIVDEHNSNGCQLIVRTPRKSKLADDDVIHALADLGYAENSVYFVQVIMLDPVRS